MQAFSIFEDGVVQQAHRLHTMGANVLNGKSFPFYYLWVTAESNVCTFPPLRQAAKRYT